MRKLPRPLRILRELSRARRCGDSTQVKSLTEELKRYDEARFYSSTDASQARADSAAYSRDWNRKHRRTV